MKRLLSLIIISLMIIPTLPAIVSTGFEATINTPPTNNPVTAQDLPGLTLVWSTTGKYVYAAQPFYLVDGSNETPVILTYDYSYARIIALNGSVIKKSGISNIKTAAMYSCGKYRAVLHDGSLFIVASGTTKEIWWYQPPDYRTFQIFEYNDNLYTLHMGSSDHVYIYNACRFTTLFEIVLPQYIESSSNGYLRAIGINGSRLMFAARLYGSRKIAVFSIDMASQSLTSYSVSPEFPSESSAGIATIGTRYIGIHYASVSPPWFAGYDSYDGLLVTYNAVEDEWRIFNASESLGITSITHVSWVKTEEHGWLVLVAGRTTDEEPVAAVALVDPRSGTAVQKLVLDGVPAPGGLRAERGVYSGFDALYLLASKHLVVLSVEDDGVQVVGDMPTDINVPVGLTFSSASDGFSVLSISGKTSDGAVKGYVYVVGSVGPATRISLDMPPSAYLGSTVSATITLTSISGDPVSGEVVVLEELTSTGWTPVASKVTGSDGAAVVTFQPTHRGVHSYRAVFPGSESWAPSMTMPKSLVVMMNVSIGLELSSNITVEGVPVDALITLSGPGGPVSGVWVTLYALAPGNIWVPIGAGLTGPAGNAVITVNLPAGNYTLMANASDPFLALLEVPSVELRVFKPLEPPPEGPYLAPAGRVLAYPPVMAEVGETVNVVFMLYYGENPVQAEDTYVAISPAETYTLLNPTTGVYVVSFTPHQTGTYTVILEAHLNYAIYTGAAVFTVFNITGKVSAWEESINQVLTSLLQINSTLTSYLENITETLNRLNLSEIQAVMAQINRNTSLLVTYAESMNSTLESLISSGTAMILKNISLVRGDLSNISAGLNGTLATILRVNESLAGLIKQLNGTIVDVIETSTRNLAGELKTNRLLIMRINTTLGTVLAVLNETSYRVALNGEGLVEVQTSLGNISMGLLDALARLDSVTGIVTGINITVNGLEAKIMTSNQTITSILLDRIDPRLVDIRGNTALINTTLGLVLANLSALGGQASALLQLAEQNTNNISDISSKIDALNEKITGLQQSIENSLQKTMQEAGSVGEKADSARNVALASAGLATVSLIGVALQLLRKP